MITNNKVPISLMTDSYKMSHFNMYPKDMTFATAYLHPRKPLKDDDHRIVVFGVRWFLENYFYRKWTEQDVIDLAEFMKTYNAGGTSHPFPEELFYKFVKDNDGYFPVKVQALQDGDVVYPGTPVLIFSAYGEYSPLVTWLEAVAMQSIWYMSTVATISRMVVSEIEEAFNESVDESSFWKLQSRFHDFGFRGCTSVEQSIMGSMAHLLSSEGTDTLSGAFYAQKNWNKGVPVASSIPATEHSVMTAHKDELSAINRVVDHYGSGVFATVADSYDYKEFIFNILPMVAPKVKEMGGFHVVRPDSGDPVICVIEGLRALEEAYGVTVNSKGYKVLHNSAIIQGDGITPETVTAILEHTLKAGYSAENVLFGMGGGLLQKVNRDTLSFACKLSAIRENYEFKPVMKDPKTDPKKRSLPGIMDVVMVNGIPTVVHETVNESELKVYQSSGSGTKVRTFSEMREALNKKWKNMPKIADPISEGSKSFQEMCSRNK